MFFLLENLRKFSENIALIEYDNENKLSEDVIALISKYVRKNEAVGIFYTEISKSSSVPLIFG